MAPRHVVVDGSNIATEGRSLPSLAQLDEAVREFMEEYPGITLTVVVDATFGHRIDESERQAFDEAEAANEVVSPPAGAIGRGDAFLLRIADKVGATVFSNDSFQEFHGEYPWLVDETRCYIPLSAMGDPAPHAAKEVLNRGEDSDFVVQAFDPSRRGIELALPAFAHLAGRPTDETVEAEIAEAQTHEAAVDAEAA